MFYHVQATIVHHTNDKYCVSCDVTKQIPTFHLNADLLGIVDKEHAERIAREIICPVDLQYESCDIHLSIYTEYERDQERV